MILFGRFLQFLCLTSRFIKGYLAVCVKSTQNIWRGKISFISLQCVNITQYVRFSINHLNFNRYVRY